MDKLRSRGHMIVEALGLELQTPSPEALAPDRLLWPLETPAWCMVLFIFLFAPLDMITVYHPVASQSASIPGFL